MDVPPEKRPAPHFQDAADWRAFELNQMNELDRLEFDRLVEEQTALLKDYDDRLQARKPADVEAATERHMADHQKYDISIKDEYGREIAKQPRSMEEKYKLAQEAAVREVETRISNSLGELRSRQETERDTVLVDHRELRLEQEEQRQLKLTEFRENAQDITGQHGPDIEPEL
ncbi:MAG: hypothetical protein AAFQ66_08840 [Pseudomonadota bacterium]